MIVKIAQKLPDLSVCKESNCGGRNFDKKLHACCSDHVWKFMKLKSLLKGYLAAINSQSFPCTVYKPKEKVLMFKLIPSFALRFCKQPTWICTTWPRFPFTCRSPFHYNYRKFDRFSPFLSIRIVLSCFYLLIFHFESRLNLNPTFAVYCKRDA